MRYRKKRSSRRGTSYKKSAVRKQKRKSKMYNSFRIARGGLRL